MYLLLSVVLRKVGNGGVAQVAQVVECLPSKCEAESKPQYH
jgi:hypothetical protein